MAYAGAMVSRRRRQKVWAGVGVVRRWWCVVFLTRRCGANAANLWRMATQPEPACARRWAGRGFRRQVQLRARCLVGGYDGTAEDFSRVRKAGRPGRSVVARAGRTPGRGRMADSVEG